MDIKKTLLIENDVQDYNINTIGDFFESYQLGKVNSITHSKIDNTAIVKLDYWCDNQSAKNMCERIYHHGEAHIVYDDPNYFTVKFLEEQYEEPDTADYRDDYVKRENLILEQDNQSYNEICYRDNYDEIDENTYDNENNYIEDEHECENNNYLEDDVIENSTNIEELFKIIEELKLQVIDNKKLIKSFKKQLGNISKKTNIMYKHRPKISKRSVWSGRLRRRIV